MIVHANDGLQKLAQVHSIIRNALGLGTMLSSSKSLYRKTFPEKDPAFNAYLLWQDDAGLLWPVWGGDLELTECGAALQDLSKAIAKEVYDRGTPCDLFVYYESTVHNSTFNGRTFPYADWAASVQHGNYLRRNAS